MKTISKSDQKRLAELASKMEAMRGTLDEACAVVEDYVRAANEKIEAFNEQVSAFNELVNEANGVIEDIWATMQDYADERSEKWQESETGEAFNEWLGEWTGFSLEEVEEMDLIDEPEMPEISAPEALADDLPPTELSL